MSYVIKTVLSNAQHPEFGQVTVPFPIPDAEYDHTMELLEMLKIGDALTQDCRVDCLDSFYTVLNRLDGSAVNVDELDYLTQKFSGLARGFVVCVLTAKSNERGEHIANQHLQRSDAVGVPVWDSCPV